MPALRQIISRADDAGSCPAANHAIKRCLRAGTVTAVGFMVPAPAFEAAVQTLGPELGAADIGVHATLNAEWTAVRWGPVLPRSDVPSLVNTEGLLLPRPHDLLGRVEIREIIAEVSAQVARLREAGLSPHYLDTHMGFDWLPGVGAALAAFAAAEHLRYVPRSPPYLDLGSPEGPGDRLATAWLRRIAAAAPGAYQLVTHPGSDSPDLHAFWHPGLAPGQIARERAAETEALCHPLFRSGLAAQDAELIRFTQLS